MQWEVALEGGGRLTVREEGARVSLRAYRADDRKGLYKVWIFGETGRRFLLGTLAPEGEGLTLARTLSRAQLERECCWPVTAGECVLAFAFARRGETGPPDWCWREDASRLFSDPVLECAVRAAGRLLYRGTEDGFLLAAPFHSRDPFPLTAIFCFGRIETVMGKRCVVFRFDGRGLPRLFDLLN